MIGILYALGGAVSWGASQVFTKAGVGHASVARFVLLRAIVGLGCIAVYGALGDGFVLPGFSLLLWAAAAGALDCFLGTMLFVLALQRIDTYEAAPLANSAPLWGVLGAWLLLHEPFSLTAFVAALLAIGGAYLLTSRRGQASSKTSMSGFALALGAGISWGIAETVPAKHCLAHGMDPATFQLVMLTTASALWAIAFGVARMRCGGRGIGRRGTVTAVVTGFLGFFLGWILWLKGVELSPASLIAPIRGATILFASAGGVIFLRERPSRRALAGVAVIVAAVVLVLVGVG